MGEDTLVQRRPKGADDGAKEEQGSTPLTKPGKASTAPLSPLQRKISMHKSKLEKLISPLANKVTEAFTETAWFAGMAKKAFHQFDLDHSGQLDEAELFACLLKLNDEMNFRLPTHVMGPSRADVAALFKKYDRDRSGGLDLDEFLTVARQVYGVTSLQFSAPVHVTVVILMRLVVLPIVAAAILGSLKAIGGWIAVLAWMPSAVLVIVLEMVVRQVWASYLAPL